MNNYQEVLAGIVKSIYYKFPRKIRIKSNGETVSFELDYNTSQKIASVLGRSYYFGTTIRYDTKKEFEYTFKELLKVKRALQEVYEKK